MSRHNVDRSDTSIGSDGIGIGSDGIGIGSGIDTSIESGIGSSIDISIDSINSSDCSDMMI